MNNKNDFKFTAEQREAIMKALDDPEKRRKIIEILEEAGALAPGEID